MKTNKFDAFKHKNEVDSFVRKLYKFLRNERHIIEFKHLRSCGGWMLPYQFPTVITLDPRNDYIAALIHEVLHYVYQYESETWVKTMQPRISKQLSQSRIDYIHMLLISRI